MKVRLNVIAKCRLSNSNHRSRLSCLITVLSLFMFGNGLQAQVFSVSSNMVGYLDLGTMNLEFSYAPSRHWSLHAGFRYNPWTFGSVDDTATYEAYVEGSALWNRKTSVALSTRWWPWHVYSGWWVRSGLQLMDYDRFSKWTSRQVGKSLGVTFGGGWSRMISVNWNVEFGAAFWVGAKKERRYDGRIESGDPTPSPGVFILPDDVYISFVYVF